MGCRTPWCCLREPFIIPFISDAPGHQCLYNADFIGIQKSKKPQTWLSVKMKSNFQLSCLMENPNHAWLCGHQPIFCDYVDDTHKQTYVWLKCFLTGNKCSRKVSRKVRPISEIFPVRSIPLRQRLYVEVPFASYYGSTEWSKTLATNWLLPKLICQNLSFLSEKKEEEMSILSCLRSILGPPL